MRHESKGSLAPAPIKEGGTSSNRKIKEGVHQRKASNLWYEHMKLITVHMHDF